MGTSPLHVVVIGAGLAGLAAARRLQAHQINVTVLEQAPVVGGRVHTALEAGCQIELGAEFLASFYTRTLSIIDELGLSEELVRIPRSAAILRNAQLYSLWPTARVALTPLIGSREKLALSYMLASLMRHSTLLDLHHFAKAHQIDDSSVTEYATAHLSPDLLEYVLQPALAGIFYWVPERTSRAMLLLLLRAGLSRPQGMQLYTLRNGLGELPAAMARDCSIRLNTSVESAERQADGRFLIQTNAEGSSETLHADALICATTARQVPRILPWLSEEQRAFFAAVRYSATALLATATPQRLPRDYYALLFPRRESSLLASATIQAVKNAQAAPDGRDLLALHMAGPAMDGLHTMDDYVLGKLLLAEIRRLAPGYAPTEPVLFQRIYRCPEALPEFDVGHFQRLQQFATGGVEEEGLFFAGDYLGGPYVEGAIMSGEAAAERLLGKR